LRFTATQASALAEINAALGRFFLSERAIMAVQTPNGAVIAFAAGYGSALTVSVATNANPCVMTSTAHGLTAGDYVEVTSGWSRLTDKVVRVANVTANTFEVEGYDTTSTTVYSAGSGIGSVRKITSFTQLTQILSSATSGGDQNFLTYQFVESDAQKQIPTFKSPQTITFGVGDDPTLPGYIVCKTANDDRQPRAVRVTLPNSSKILYNGYVSLNPTPSLTVNELMQVQVTVSQKNEPVRYAT
jgi:hypothetical protein